MAFENKFGKSAVDAARNNALPPYLDILFREGGAGGADIEVLEFDLYATNWVQEDSGFSQNVTQESVVSDGSAVILLSAEGAACPASGAGVKLSNVQLDLNNMATFIFSMPEQPVEDIKAIVLVITSNSAVAARFRDILNELNTIYGNCISVQSQVNQAASNASASATNAANSATDAAGSADSAAADAAVCSGIVSDAAAALQSQLHPVGSTYITSTNTNPSSVLGIGTWELYDKEFAPYSSTTSILSMYTTYVSSVSGFLLIRKGHDITIRFQLTTNAALGYADRNLVNFTTSSIGLTGAYADWDVIGSSSNNSNNIDGIILGQLNGDNDNTTFILSSRSTVTRVSEQQIPSGSIVSFLLRPLFTFDQMMDSACNKFYWRRTQ